MLLLLLLSCFSRVRLFETPWTAAHQAPPSMGFFQARVLEWGALAFSGGHCYMSTNAHRGYIRDVSCAVEVK